MGPSAQKHTIDDFNADNFDHRNLGFIRGAQISAGPAGLEGGPIASAMNMPPPPGVPRWGAGYRDFFVKYYTRHLAMTGQTENLPYADQTIDLDPNIRDAWGLPAPRMTYDWRRPNEVKRVSFINKYAQSWDIPNLFVIGSANFPTSAGFNPTLTIQALAYMTADVIANRYRKSPGPLA
jgi:gluconate 2-dehydrogenase alpha chain